MNFTREEAQILVNLINVRDVTEATMPVLVKIEEAFPDLLDGTLKALVKEEAKKSALQQISDFLEEAKRAIRKAEDVADRTGVGFDFSMDPDRTTYYEPNNGWVASDYC